LVGVLALGSLTVLTGCPSKTGPAEKTTAEPERAEPDDEGKTTTEARRPSAAPAPAPREKDDDKKPDEDKDKGGW
jgi:hypothetical protein